MLLLRLAANIVSHHRLSKGKPGRLSAHTKMYHGSQGYTGQCDMNTPLLTARRGCLIRDGSGHSPAEREDNELVGQDNQDAAELARLLHARALHEDAPLTRQQALNLIYRNSMQK